MIDRLLVWPVSVGLRAQSRRIADRVVPPILRLAVACLRTLFRGRGVGMACTVAARLISSGGRVAFNLGGGGSFLVAIDDRYWLLPLLLDRSYELDLDHFLRRTLKPQDIFLDCGANLGLWSVAAAQLIRDQKRVIAVEAGSNTFSQLLTNWEANDKSFTVMHRALSDVSGNQVSFFASAGDPASATLVEVLSTADARPETITTISLLDLLLKSGWSAADGALVFVKLDIEGMERQVLATIDSVQHGDFVILYEDHVTDTTNSVTAFMLDRGFRVAFLADDGSLEQIHRDALERLNVLKVNPACGLNLVGICPSGAAISRLREIGLWS